MVVLATQFSEESLVRTEHRWPLVGLLDVDMNSVSIHKMTDPRGDVGHYDFDQD